MSVIRPATGREVQWIASRLRQPDEQEVRTATGLDPVDAFLMAPLDTTYTIRPDRFSDPVCLFGLMPVSPKEATVWLVGTDDLSKVARALVGELPGWLEAWNKQYPIIFNHVDSRNELHHRYLKKLGFEFRGEIELRGVPFYEIRYLKCALR